MFKQYNTELKIHEIYFVLPTLINIETAVYIYTGLIYQAACIINFTGERSSGSQTDSTIYTHFYVQTITHMQFCKNPHLYTRIRELDHASIPDHAHDIIVLVILKKQRASVNSNSLERDDRIVYLYTHHAADLKNLEFARSLRIRAT